MYLAPSAAIRLPTWMLLKRIVVMSVQSMVKLAWIIGLLYGGVVGMMSIGPMGIILGVLGLVAGTVGGALLGLLNGIICVLVTIVAFRPLHAPQDHYRMMLAVSATVTGLGTFAELLVSYALLGGASYPSSLALATLIPALLASVGGLWIGHQLAVWYRQEILREARMEHRTYSAVFLDARLPDHAGTPRPHNDTQTL